MERMLNQLLNCGWDASVTDPIRLRRIRTTAAVCYLLILVGIPFLIRAYEWHISLRMITVPAAIVLAVASLLVLGVFRQFEISTQLVTLAVFVGGAGAVLTGGGIGTSSLGWWILVPLLAGLLRGLGSSLAWGAIVLGSIYGCYLAQGYGFHFPDMTPPEHVVSQQLLQALGITCAVLILVSSYLSQLGQSEARLAEQNQSLQDQVARAERAEQELTRALQSKNRFLSNMSHEMKTPLNSIVGFSHQLQKRVGDSLDQRGQESLRQVIRHSGNMLQLVNDLLALSHLDNHDPGRDQRLPLDLTEVLVRTVNEVSALAREHELRILLDAPDSNIVQANGEQILQVISSLVRYALAAAKGREIRISLGEMPQGALLQVVYEGELLEQDKARLFDRYNHLHSQLQRDVGMSALALALAREHVERHAGRININFDPEPGNVCFNLFLPY